MKALEIIEMDAKENTWSHAYLITGGDAAANQAILKKVISSRGCLPCDITVVQPSGESGKRGDIKIEAIRAAIHELSLSPYGKMRLAVFYNAEKLNPASANILLKTIEEPPEKVMIILFAANEKVLLTIKSRCRLIRASSNIKEQPTTDDFSFIEDTFLEISKKVETIVKENQTEECLDALEDILRKKLLADKSLIAAKLIKKVESIRKDIRNNANPKLALEALILMIRELK